MRRARRDPRAKALGQLLLLVAAADIKGIRRMEGVDPEPDWPEMVEAIQEVPEKLPVQVPRGLTEAERNVFLLEKVEKILSVCGGWSGVVKAVKEFKSRRPDKWRGFKVYMRMQVSPVFLFDTVGEIADRESVSPSTLWRWKEKIPLAIACLAMSLDSDVEES
jgi:hypothetical protein